MLTLGEIAERTGSELIGDPEQQVAGVCTLQNGRPDCIAFLANPRYRKYLADTHAGAVFVTRELAEQCPVAALVNDNPYLAYARAAALLAPPRALEPGVHPSAVVAEDAVVDPSAQIATQAVVESGADIGPGVLVGPGCVVGRDVRIGADTRLVANVTLCEGVRLGMRCLLHPGVVVGSDGFGIARDGARWVKVPQLGGVRIGDDVEIGANTTIDRGAVEDTVIESGVKLDNQIQIAHNVQIGENTAIAGCAGISGSARIGRNCMIAGGVGVVGHLEIADGVVVTGMSMVTRSIPEPGVYSSGLPAQPNEQWNRITARLRRLDDMARRLRELERRLEQGEDAD